MPTVILLDNSLSMCKYINDESADKKLTFRDLSHIIVRRLVEHISQIDEFEYISLVTFSSSSEIIKEFTRDHKQILDSLENLKIGDCSFLEEGLNKVSDLVIDEWACFTNVQILLITDSVDNMYNNSIKSLCTKLKENRTVLKDFYITNGIDFDENIHVNSILNEDIMKSNFYANNSNKKPYFNCKYPFSFPNRFDIVCLADKEQVKEVIDCLSYGFDDDNFQVKKLSIKTQNKLFCLNELIKLNSNSTGKLYVTEKLDTDYISKEFCDLIIGELFNTFECSLKCGNLKSNVNLIPTPIPFKGYQNYAYVNKEINKVLEICGFINIAELMTPPTISRHLILSLDDKTDQVTPMQIDDPDVLNDEQMQSIFSEEKGSFSVLLHESLKSENMSAIVNLGDEWFGAIYCWQDNKNTTKKKSNLMLSIFVPGNDVIQNIISKVAPTAASKSPNQANQIIKPPPVKSYTKGCIVWYKSNNLQSDIQKIIRNAKKMQDKMPIFYKELNRVRKAALSFGFYELFNGLALMLERELNNINSNTNNESIVQLRHCVNCLRSDEYKDYRKDIAPFVSNAPFHRQMKK